MAAKTKKSKSIEIEALGEADLAGKKGEALGEADIAIEQSDKHGDEEVDEDADEEEIDEWFDKHLEGLLPKDEDDDSDPDDDEEVDFSDFSASDAEDDDDLVAKAQKMRKLSRRATAEDEDAVEDDELTNLAFDEDSDVDGFAENEVGDVDLNENAGGTSAKKRAREDRNEAALARRYGGDAARKIKRMRQSYMRAAADKADENADGAFASGGGAFASAEDFDDLLDL